MSQRYPAKRAKKEGGEKTAKGRGGSPNLGFLDGGRMEAMSEADDSRSSLGIILNVKEQNVYHHFSLASEVLDWLQHQMEFWNELSPIAQTNLDLGNLGHFQTQQAYSQIAQKWTRWANSIKSDPSNTSAVIQDISGHAASFDLIIPEGTIGKHLSTLVSRNDNQQALLIIFTFNTSIVSFAHPLGMIAKLLKTVVQFHPLSKALVDVASAKTAEQIARDAADAISTKNVAFDEWRKSQEESIEKLSDRFRKELPFEKPAAHWRQIARSNNGLVFLYLVLFGALVAVPSLIIYQNWTAVVPAIESLFAKSQGVLPIGPFLLLLIPAAAFGWFLKHISRLFIQSYALAVDAEHRRSLAITYLGLMDYEKTQINDAERAIILNALFRPPPPYSTDDGPPMGLLDLIKSSK
jgi:hypothetical protein